MAIGFLRISLNWSEVESEVFFYKIIHLIEVLKEACPEVFI